MFLSDSCLGKACYDRCKFEYDKSSADIRIGDLWGKTYASDEDGVSAAVAFTERGDEFLHHCNCTLIEHTFDVVAEGQMKECPERTRLYVIIMSKLLDNERLADIMGILERYKRLQKWSRRITAPGKSLVNLVKQICKK